MRRLLLLTPLAVVLAFGCDAPSDPAGPDVETTLAHSVVSATGGKIVVNHDEWPLGDFSYSVSTPGSVDRFVRNVAGWFTGGGPGNFLAYSNNFGLTGTSLAATMAAAGHTWTVSTAVPVSLASFQAYDAVFLGGVAVDNNVLISYVNAGGKVYVMGGTGIGGPAAEAALWNAFLNNFGLNYVGTAYNLIKGVIPPTSGHPIFAGVTDMYHDNGNTVTELNASDPKTDIFDGGMFGVYDGSVGAPPPPPPPGERPLELRRYRVTIENLTKGQPFSPGVIVTHESGARLFEGGKAASAGLKAIAENGDPSVAEAALSGAPGIHEVVATGAPIHRMGGPGSNVMSVEIEASARARYLSLALMLICTNDGFIGLNTVTLPGGFEKKVVQAVAYDAGTERNDERSRSIVDACGAIGPVALDVDGNDGTAQGGVVGAHPGIAGVGALSPSLHGWYVGARPGEPRTIRIARVTIERLFED